MYLIDTNVFSELRKPMQHPGVTQWFRAKPQHLLFLSIVTIGELERGIARQHARNPGFAEVLLTWVEKTIADYADRLIPVDTAIARRWGRLSARIGNSGADLMIAATALEHSLTVVTRNIRHFAPTGVAIENPFDS